MSPVLMAIPLNSNVQSIGVSPKNPIPITTELHELHHDVSRSNPFGLLIKSMSILQWFQSCSSMLHHVPSIFHHFPLIFPCSTLLTCEINMWTSKKTGISTPQPLKLRSSSPCTLIQWASPVMVGDHGGCPHCRTYISRCFLILLFCFICIHVSSIL